MKKKSLLSLMLAGVMTMAAVTGCGSAASDGGAASTPAATESASTDAADDGAAETAEATEVNHDELLTLEIYDVAANYQGIQAGWYGQIVKDKFNLELNIIAPQVSGDAASLYQTRCAAGNLGDIVILDNADMMECVDAGLVLDISNELPKCENLMKYNEQINLFNAMVGDGTGTYAIPLEMNLNGPTAFKDAHVAIYPRLPWDYYTAIGAPKCENLDDFLACMRTMQDTYPTNENGDLNYAISLWADWDSQYSENVAQLTKIYGQEVNGSVLIGVDNTITPLTDKAGAYYKMLNFLYKANQMGLVDPDSATQDWNNIVSKMSEKRIFMLWYSWQYGFWNNPDRGQSRENYVEIPIADTNLYQTSNTYYGDGRVIGVGSQVEGEKLDRIMEFLEWYASPEGLVLQHAGTEPLIYTINDDGTYTLTPEGEVRFSSEVIVPDELGGGNWNDGNNAINQWIVAAVETNPLTGEPYDSNLWASSIERNQTTTTKEWSEMFGAKDDVEYLAKNGMMTTVASVNVALAIDSTDISLIRNQCGDLIKDTSWKMIFAKDDAEFDAMWDAMCTDLEGLGYADLVAFDTEKYQPVIEARK